MDDEKRVRRGSRPSKPSTPRRSKPGAARKPTNPRGNRPKRAGGAAAANRAAAQRRANRERLLERAKRAKRNAPPPPKRRQIRRPAARKESLSPEDQAKVDALERRYSDLEEAAQLSSVYDAIGRIESRLTEMPLELDELRNRGYVHGGQLEDRLVALDDQWDEMMPRVERTVKEQVERLDEELEDAERKVERLDSGSSAVLSAAERALDTLDRRVDAARSSAGGLYDDLEMELGQIEAALHRAGRLIDLMDESPEIRLYEAEGPLLGVKAEWHRDGKEGPKGYAFLTDQRFLFEQREEIKKKTGLFSSEKEKVQKLHLDIAVHDIEKIEHAEEGGFLGMGKDDILELVCGGDSPVSRARFHLDGQDSADWAAMIKRIQTGDIDNDRDDDFMEDIEAAEAVAASFPTQCPTCFAAVPEVPRGVDRITCEFCGGVITPEAE